MDLDTHKSAYDEAVVSWLENAMNHARAHDQAKVCPTWNVSVTN